MRAVTLGPSGAGAGLLVNLISRITSWPAFDYVLFFLGSWALISFLFYFLFRLINPFLIRVFARDELWKEKDEVVKLLAQSQLHGLVVNPPRDKEDLVKELAWKDYKRHWKNLARRES